MRVLSFWSTCRARHFCRLAQIKSKNDYRLSRTKPSLSDFSEKCNSFSVVGNYNFTPETQVRHKKTSCFLVLCLPLVVSLLLFLPNSGFIGKALPAPRRNVLCVLPKPSFGPFPGLRNEYCPLKQEKQRLVSAKILARSVGAFYLNT